MSLLDSYYDALSVLVPPTRMVRSRTLNRVLHQLPYTRLRKPRIGLFQPDDLLGWSHRRGVEVVHPSYEFRARYGIDEAGRRRTVRPPGRDVPDVLVLGCSWAFGHGVNDDETLAQQLAGRGVGAENWACMGYGPTQAYLQLRREVEVGSLPCRADGLVAYVWVPDQLMRAWRRREWVELNAWISPGRPSHPVVDLEQGRLRPAGLIGPAESVAEDPLLPGLVDRMEWRLTTALLRGLQELAESVGRRFAVVTPPVPGGDRNQTTIATLQELLAADQVPVIDLRELSGLPDDDLFYRFDGHPRAIWHELVAGALAELEQRHIHAA